MRARLEAEFAAKLRAVESEHALELQAAQRSSAAPRSDDYDSKSVPLLKATRALLAEEAAAAGEGDASDGEDADVFSGAAPAGPPAEVAGLLRAARDVPSHRQYPHYGVDLVLVEHAAASRDWPRALVAARRVVRSAERYASGEAPPAALASLAEAVNERERAVVLQSTDRAAFDSALANGDFELAAVLGEQIVAAPGARPPGAPAEDDGDDGDGWV